MDDKRYVFQRLKDFLVPYGEQYEGIGLTLSATLKDKELGAKVLVGGRVTRHSEDFYFPANHYVELDDDIDTVSIYMIGPVYNEYCHLVEPGNVVLSLGYVAERKPIHLRYVICTSIELVSAKEEITS